MLEGKTALVTGATSGIGLATARLMRAHGARVVIAGRSHDKLEAAREQIGDDVLALEVDLLSRTSLQRMADSIKETIGGLDVFFANAGMAFVTPLATTDEEAYDQLMDTNAKSVFFSLQAVEPILHDGASVIFNTAWLNQVGLPGRAVLSASKAAVRSFARTFSAELLPRRIRVNAVSPGLVDTPLLQGVGQSQYPGQTEAEFKEYLAAAARKVPVGRLARPDEIAQAVLFLASDASRYMLGTEMLVDGGLAEL